MSPSNAPDEFDALRRLLALKRHETPPPGYLSGFSARVIDRIEAEEAAPSRSWWQWLSEHLVARPVFAGLGGLTAGIMVVGLLAPTPQEQPEGMDLARAGMGLAATASLQTARPVTDSGLMSFGDASSVAPVVDRPSAFSRGLHHGAAMNVSYTPAR